MPAWTIEYEGDAFERFVASLPPYEQAVLIAAIENVLAVYGIDICASEWGKPLGGGLYEFRVRKSGGGRASVSATAHRAVLIRVFCTFYENKVVLLYGGYDKRRDPSAKRQQREIANARKTHARWKSQRRR